MAVDIASQWHPTKNTTTPSQVGNGTPQQAWWQCKIGHEWRAAVNSRTKKGTGCPFCAGKAVLPGYNDLQTTRPDLAREWHSTRNPLTPTAFTSGSNKKVWWACSSGHEWQSTIINRSSGGYGCPVCTNRTVLPGYNDLATVMPQLASQWHPTRNTVKPTEVTIGSKKKIWWQCNEGHEWQAPPESRSIGQDCPYCSNRRALQGFNDLATTHPHLIPEWHPDNTRSPESVTFGSDHEALWICTAHQHQWKAEVQRRSSGSSCPICSGYKVLAGFNDLTTTRPVLAAEWHPTRNTAPPTEYSAGSGTKAWWTCDKNHAWKATISNRAYGGAGCPRCNAGTSRREREVCKQIAALLKVYDYDGPRRVDGCPIPIDFVAAELGIVIEYDGWYWHKEKFDSDTRKCRLLEELGWTVVRIRERGSRQERLPLLDVPFIECGPNEPAHVVAERIYVLLRSLVPTAFKEIDDAHSALSDKQFPCGSPSSAQKETP
ncbi:zinc-ribbon domain-containing protein [Rhodococcus sp. WY5]|uniref:zinc-ribbon domain-containing protein n=1 Tax=Rhodococcus sp. WY5 TaxID=2708349 RepID=UPI001BDF6B76|nr:zinc-ribbon domain-containing protein [Rhodococcus sp. WY5]